ncbi:hairy/enhancer-of-split related with YRPW motif protein-like isoform X2 [Dysidea avara]|uniref:hairy/enhancer-of-split related with YRPW motif protein-like isoform X2 n=1 Tax=Dysidea avara TaxID=196820 RepID=UPI003321FAF7
MDLGTIEVVENSVVGQVENSDTSVIANSVAQSLMEQQIVISQAQPDTVQVQQVEPQATSEIQVEPEVHIQLQPEFQTEVQVLNLPQHEAAALQNLVQQQKRELDDDQIDTSPVPRKKTRSYLDSHKVIEKKRRDRINTCLTHIKNLIPDCRQYGNKKLDKAEILEMTIEYLGRLQQQGVRSAGVPDLSQAQREWANEITTWIIQNKLLYSGPNAVDQFCNSLLLHLQNFGGQSVGNNTLQNIASVLLSQTTDEGDANQLYRQLVAQQLQQRAQQEQQEEQETASPKPPTSDDEQQQKEQSSQMQTIQSILLQQIIQQQLQQQGLEQHGLNLQQLQLLISQQLSAQDTASKQSSVQQLLTTLQQLQQLSQKHGVQLIQTQVDDDGSGQAVTSQGISISTVFADPQMAGQGSSENEGVELSLPTDQGQDGVAAATEESVYTSSIEGLPEHLLNTQTPSNVQGVQMWSSGGDDAHDNDTENAENSALLILSTEEKPQPPDLLSQDEQ